MPEQIDAINPNPEGSGGRSMCKWIRKGGQSVVGLLEWTTAAPEAFGAYLAAVEERVPTHGNRAEEVHTLRIDGLFSEGPRTAIIYRCSQQPMDIREILLRTPKPSGDERRALSRIVATQVRSLHVHFELCHTALRTESFAFAVLGNNPEKPDLTRPYVLDWARPPTPDMYQHPAYQVGNNRPQWFYQAWSLMMVLSEIAEWKPLDSGAFRDEAELRKGKLARKQLVTSPGWKGAATAAIFQLGFGVLTEDQSTLEQFSRWDVKRFYDELCELLAP